MIPMMIDDLYPRMPWDKIDAVVFDVGQVLLRFDPAQLLDRLVPQRPDLHDALLARVFKSPYWVMLDRGTATVEELIAVMCTGAPEEMIPHIHRIMTGWWDIDEIPEGVRALKACKAHGKKLYVLSNYGDKPFAHAEATHDLFSLFDDKLVSSRHHVIKPDPAIYALAQQRFGLDPARTLFIDDAPANIEGALQAGWQGLCFNHPGKLDAFMGV